MQLTRFARIVLINAAPVQGLQKIVHRVLQLEPEQPVHVPMEHLIIKLPTVQVVAINVSLVKLLQPHVQRVLEIELIALAPAQMDIMIANLLIAPNAQINVLFALQMQLIAKDVQLKIEIHPTVHVPLEPTMMEQMQLVSFAIPFVQHALNQQLIV
jgi:hypothetical protein